MSMLLSISKSLTVSQKTLFKISAHVLGLEIISLPCECYFTVTGCFVREKGRHLLPKHFIISNESRAQTFIEVILNLPKKRETVISLCFVCLPRIIGF